MDNFSYSSFTLNNKNKDTGMNFGLLKTALRDTSVYYYRQAYDTVDVKEMLEYDSGSDDEIYKIINFALLVTNGVVV